MPALSALHALERLLLADYVEKVTASSCRRQNCSVSERGDGFAHQASDPVPATRMPHGRQLGFDTTMAINPIHLVLDGADFLAQTPIRISLAEGGRCCQT